MDINTIMKILKEQVKEPSNPVKEVIEPVKVEVVKPKRCQHEGCKVKLMLADFACRCSGFYCSSHRFSEAHKCSFDYKTQGLDTLTKQMQTVAGTKLNKI
jgi:hypothetical protein